MGKIYKLYQLEKDERFRYVTLPCGEPGETVYTKGRFRPDIKKYVTFAHIPGKPGDGWFAGYAAYDAEVFKAD